MTTEKKTMPKQKEDEPILAIAYDHDFDVIPFENVLAVRAQKSNCPSIEIHVSGVPDSFVLHGQATKDFLSAYRTYLHIVQAVTLSPGDLDE